MLRLLVGFLQAIFVISFNLAITHTHISIDRYIANLAEAASLENLIARGNDVQSKTGQSGIISRHILQVQHLRGYMVLVTQYEGMLECSNVRLPFWLIQLSITSFSLFSCQICTTCISV